MTSRRSISFVVYSTLSITTLGPSQREDLVVLVDIRLRVAHQSVLSIACSKRTRRRRCENDRHLRAQCASNQRSEFVLLAAISMPKPCLTCRFLEYGYGFLCVLFISTFSLVGALIYPLTKKRYFKYFNATLTSVAVGALLSNSIFELIPAVRRTPLACRSVAMISEARDAFS